MRLIFLVSLIHNSVASCVILLVMAVELFHISFIYSSFTSSLIVVDDPPPMPVLNPMSECMCSTVQAVASQSSSEMHNHHYSAASALEGGHP